MQARTARAAFQALALATAFASPASALDLDAGLAIVLPNGDQPLQTVAPALTVSLDSRMGTEDAGVRLQFASALSPLGWSFPAPNLFSIEGFLRWDTPRWHHVQLGGSLGFLAGVACLAGSSCGGVGLVAGLEGLRYLGAEAGRGWFFTGRLRLAWGAYGSGTSLVLLPEASVGYAW